MSTEVLSYEMRNIIKIYKDDPEIMHMKLDELLLEYVGSETITNIFNNAVKYYS